MELLKNHSTHSQHFPKTISSEALLGQMKQLVILHDGYFYQLRITKLGKLILTK
ncbi:hemin uptake protein HemP [Polynucleobacter sp. UB-Raua-W9]|uniref:hemin uptake protein HemP n=1 Tax=Polynucleobacter sp. UB-Raua-W9 TaxID=1819736 RepID=UPI002111056F|nr:hemin uptake protein HemP [Polynucleobacter sp. UB-Raua-W9]